MAFLIFLALFGAVVFVLFIVLFLIGLLFGEKD